MVVDERKCKRVTNRCRSHDHITTMCKTPERENILKGSLCSGKSFVEVRCQRSGYTNCLEPRNATATHTASGCIQGLWRHISKHSQHLQGFCSAAMHQAATLFAPNHRHGAPHGEASKCRFGVVAPVVSKIHPLNNNLCYIYSGLESILENVALRWDKHEHFYNNVLPKLPFWGLNYQNN